MKATNKGDIMKELIEKVKVLATEELKNANKKFPMFSSTHEGWAVISEEFQESSEELGYVKRELEIIWNYIRSNDKNYVTSHIKSLQIDALNLAAEAIQVAAMAQKFIDSELV